MPDSCDNFFNGGICDNNLVQGHFDSDSVSLLVVSWSFSFVQVTYALAWGNLQMFDFNDRLLNEKVSLNLWPMPQGMDELLNPIGISGITS